MQLVSTAVSMAEAGMTDATCTYSICMAFGSYNRPFFCRGQVIEQSVVGSTNASLYPESRPPQE
eukprot:scaffold106479_cov14-Prasinocladus_malaysianus.AAC.1